jgi:hypothetical protein
MTEMLRKMGIRRIPVPTGWRPKRPPERKQTVGNPPGRGDSFDLFILDEAGPVTPVWELVCERCEAGEAMIYAPGASGPNLEPCPRNRDHHHVNQG